LVPIIQELPVFNASNSESERLIQEFNNYGCKNPQLEVYKDRIPAECHKFICNIDVFHDHAPSCECKLIFLIYFNYFVTLNQPSLILKKGDPTGSTSSICNKFGGQCDCKQNVLGKQCDICALGHWEFSPNGCQRMKHYFLDEI
jgi:hypothetical protein